ncbi:hypothetical protein [Paludisphaera rhizosphaerae]|uniref:hypothetical protein n=1 Tax=Paludisphaera rhizosphaerae TaxID=2711216 RepID=UPI0013EDD8DD|nr:hypothetical protein [Paludisphaera rhizosphaerae]
MNRLAERIGSSFDPVSENPARRGVQWALVVVVGLLGVFAAHHPMIFSGFSRIQTDLGDSRLLNYLLEHGWLWVNRTPGHDRFWDAPFFHPVKNVIAYTDSMFSYGPFYWPFRLVGFSPEVSFGLFLITSTVLNYAAGVLLFGRGLGFGAPATAAGAGLIAFGAPRMNQLMHAQLVPFFYLLIALYALCRIIREGTASAAERASWWIVFALGVAAQFYGGVYLGWFFGVALALTAVTALVLRTSRDEVVSLIQRDWWAAVLAAAVGILVLIPFLAHYLPAAREFGGTFNDVQAYGHPTNWSWWNVGPNNWFWGWIDRRWPIGPHPFPWELNLGIGFLTTAACGVGLYLSKNSPLGRVALATMLLVLIAMTLVRNDRVVLLAGAAACFAFGCLFREPDWTERGAGAFALAVAVLLACPPYNDAIRTLTLVLMVFCWVRLWERRSRPDGLLAPGVGLFLLTLHLLPWSTMSLIAPGAVAAGAILCYFRPKHRTEIVLASVGLFLIAGALLSLESRPEVLYHAALGVAFGWVCSTTLPQVRLKPSQLVPILAVSFALVILLYGKTSLWYALSPYIPGAKAIRVPSRVVLILLVPAAFGLASLVERLDRSLWGMAAWCLALLCLVEQSGTTDCYSLAESRARIAVISQQIDPSMGTFYYRPESEESGFVQYNLDAMWASLNTGIPTINGNSGCFPKDWWPFPQADAPNKATTEAVLRAWCEKFGLDRRRVQRIGRQAGPDENEKPVSDSAE